MFSWSHPKAPGTWYGANIGVAEVFRIARYHDRFHLVEGRWWFQSRQEFTDWVSEERTPS